MASVADSLRALVPVIARTHPAFRRTGEEPAARAEPSCHETETATPATGHASEKPVPGPSRVPAGVAFLAPNELEVVSVIAHTSVDSIRNISVNLAAAVKRVEAESRGPQPPPLSELWDKAEERLEQARRNLDAIVDYVDRVNVLLNDVDVSPERVGPEARTESPDALGERNTDPPAAAG